MDSLVWAKIMDFDNNAFPTLFWGKKTKTQAAANNVAFSWLCTKFCNRKPVKWSSGWWIRRTFFVEIPHAKVMQWLTSRFDFTRSTFCKTCLSLSLLGWQQTLGPAGRSTSPLPFVSNVNIHWTDRKQLNTQLRALWPPNSYKIKTIHDISVNTWKSRVTRVPSTFRNTAVCNRHNPHLSLV